MHRVGQLSPAEALKMLQDPSLQAELVDVRIQVWPHQSTNQPTNHTP